MLTFRTLVMFAAATIATVEGPNSAESPVCSNGQPAGFGLD